jgi:hypothetical protein
MISLSLMGQYDINDINDLKKQRHAKKHHNKSFSKHEQRMSRHPEYSARHLLKEFETMQNVPLKSISADKQKMDSMYYEDYDTATSEWILADRDIFTYDSKGNMIQYVSDSLDPSTMKLVPSEKEDLTFDANGNITVYLAYVWNKSTSQWVYSEKWEETFDGNNNLTKAIIYTWDTIGNQWVKEVEYDLTYDANNLLIKEILYARDSLTSQMVKELQWENTYDGQGNITSEMASYWDAGSSAWIPGWKDEYTYTDGKLTEILESLYDEDNQEWINFFRTVSTYNAGGKLISEVTEEWDFMSNNWVNWLKWEYTWNAQERNTMEIEYEWDTGSLVWLNTWKWEYTYDQQGNTIEEVDSEWYNNQWNSDWRGVWAYNLSYTFLDLLVPYWFLSAPTDLTFVNMPLSFTEYWPELAAWILWWRQMAYWSAFTSTDVSNIEKGMVNVFPNPATDYLTVSWDDNYTHLDLEIINLAGIQVISRSIDNNETINLSQLSEGLYLYKLSDNRNVIYTGKISLK